MKGNAEDLIAQIGQFPAGNKAELPASKIVLYNSGASGTGKSFSAEAIVKYISKSMPAGAQPKPTRNTQPLYKKNQSTTTKKRTELIRHLEAQGLLREDAKEILVRVSKKNLSLEELLCVQKKGEGYFAFQSRKKAALKLYKAALQEEADSNEYRDACLNEATIQAKDMGTPNLDGGVMRKMSQVQLLMKKVSRANGYQGITDLDKQSEDIYRPVQNAINNYCKANKMGKIVTATFADPRKMGQTLVDEIRAQIKAGLTPYFSIVLSGEGEHLQNTTMVRGYKRAFLNIDDPIPVDDINLTDFDAGFESKIYDPAPYKTGKNNSLRAMQDFIRAIEEENVERINNGEKPLNVNDLIFTVRNDSIAFIDDNNTPRPVHAHEAVNTDMHKDMYFGNERSHALWRQENATKPTPKYKKWLELREKANKLQGINQEILETDVSDPKYSELTRKRDGLRSDIMEDPEFVKAGIEYSDALMDEYAKQYQAYMTPIIKKERPKEQPDILSRMHAYAQGVGAWRSPENRDRRRLENLSDIFNAVKKEISQKKSFNTQARLNYFSKKLDELWKTDTRVSSQEDIAVFIYQLPQFQEMIQLVLEEGEKEAGVSKWAKFRADVNTEKVIKMLIRLHEKIRYDTKTYNSILDDLRTRADKLILEIAQAPDEYLQDPAVINELTIIQQYFEKIGTHQEYIPYALSGFLLSSKQKGFNRAIPGGADFKKALTNAMAELQKDTDAEGGVSAVRAAVVKQPGRGSGPTDVDVEEVNRAQHQSTSYFTAPNPKLQRMIYRQNIDVLNDLLSSPEDDMQQISRFVDNVFVIPSSPPKKVHTISDDLYFVVDDVASRAKGNWTANTEDDRQLLSNLRQDYIHAYTASKSNAASPSAKRYQDIDAPNSLPLKDQVCERTQAKNVYLANQLIDEDPFIQEADFPVSMQDKLVGEKAALVTLKMDYQYEKTDTPYDLIKVYGGAVHKNIDLMNQFNASDPINYGDDYILMATLVDDDDPSQGIDIYLRHKSVDRGLPYGEPGDEMVQEKHLDADHSLSISVQNCMAKLAKGNNEYTCDQRVVRPDAKIPHQTKHPRA